jgi:NAD+ diphosphatase
MAHQKRDEFRRDIHLQCAHRHRERTNPLKLLQHKNAVPTQMLQTPSGFRGIVSLEPTKIEPDSLVFCFKGSELLVDASSTMPCVAFDSSECLAVGTLHSKAVYAQQLDSEFAVPRGMRLAGLRGLFGLLPDETVALAGRALQVLEWDRTHRFCGACATPTIRSTSERVRRCPACGQSNYPRIAPAMMCLVTKGAEILLARNANFPPGRYSALAGFVEAGESVEDAVHREVFEEVGIEVTNLRYFASQFWPFPHSLMIAFTAEYASGELRPNETEIVDAQWCSRENLPQLPPRLSIARALIDTTLERIAP